MLKWWNPWPLLPPMKTLKDEVGSLEGREETITMTELRSLPGDVMDQVSLGKVFNITRGGRILGRLVPATPCEPNAFELAAAVRKLGLAGPGYGD